MHRCAQSVHIMRIRLPRFGVGLVTWSMHSYAYIYFLPLLSCLSACSTCRTNQYVLIACTTSSNTACASKSTHLNIALTMQQTTVPRRAHHALVLRLHARRVQQVITARYRHQVREPVQVTCWIQQTSYRLAACSVCSSGKFLSTACTSTTNTVCQSKF